MTSLTDLPRADDPANETARAMNRWLLEALDHVASVGIAQLGTEEESENALLGNVGSVLFRICPFEAGAFFMLDSASADFPMAWCSPSNKRSTVEAELDRLIGDGVFAWALQRNHPILIPASTSAGSAMLHVLATRSGPVGMFLGVMAERAPFIPDGCQKLVSIVLTSCASHVRSEQLRAELRSINRGLEAAIEVRTAELRHARDTAFQASQAKSEFLANMSHEIRTPMNAVLGTTAMLLESQLDEDQLGLARIIERSGRDLLTIINDILDFSKLEAGKLRIERIPFDLPDTVQGVVAMLTPKAEAKGVRLGLKIADEVPQHIEGDPGRLRQVLTNLADNALKFTEHGFVLIHLSVTSSPQGSQLTLAVRDSGIGIAVDKLNTMFEKFTQADTSTTRRFGGTGLGLAICRQLVELMGGHLTAESVVGAGSTFTVTMPLTLQTQVAKTEPARVTATDRLTGRVLLAEDYPANQRIARWMLEKMGLRVEIVADGRQALERLAAESFDLVLMDCQMPEMDGYDATRAIRAAEGAPYQRIPIVAMTAAALPADRERCLAVGMDDYVSKPVQQTDLAQTMRRWLATAPA